MKMFKRLKFVEGVTLIEAVMAISILAIAAIGAMSYQYHAARHASIARGQITATRTAQLLLEDWKSYCFDGEVDNYDPTSLGLGFSEPLEEIPPEFTYDEVPGEPLHNKIYTITVDSLPMYVMLKWKIIDDSIAGVSLWELSVIIGFERIGAEDGNGSALEGMPPIIMTTYGSNATSG